MARRANGPGFSAGLRWATWSALFTMAMWWEMNKWRGTFRGHWDAEGYREGGDIAVLGAGGNDSAAAAERRDDGRDGRDGRDRRAGKCSREAGGVALLDHWLGAVIPAG
jgi:hypothetical protein